MTSRVILRAGQPGFKVAKSSEKSTLASSPLLAAGAAEDGRSTLKSENCQVPDDGVEDSAYRPIWLAPGGGKPFKEMIC